MFFHYTYHEERSVWFVFYPYVFSFFLSCFCFCFFCSFSIGFFSDRHCDSQDSREQWGNHYFSCFPLPPAHEYSFSSSRVLPLLFNRSICNYQTDSWWDLIYLEHFICIFIDAIQEELLTFTFQNDIWAHIKLSPFY